MSLTFYNTLTRKKEPFTPLHPGEVRMYNCGPTVYSYAHIGNFRAYVFADLLRRYLEWKGFRVRQIMNITDVGHMTVDDSLETGGEDKVEKAAAAQGRTPREIADFYAMAFFEDTSKLNIQKAYFYPRASDHVAQMQEIISALLEKGVAYQRGGNVYFEVKKFPRYGRLSGNTLRKLQAGKRLAIREEKKSPFDFALWIRNPKHLMQWDAPWGRGYPGWHIECSAMATAYLGTTLDLHTGGEDNIFPHHECEIAQSEASTGKPFVRTWLHTRHLLVDGKKMSKSLGNFYTLRDLLQKGYGPREVRFLLLSAHYRTRLNFTEKGLAASRETLAALDGFAAALRNARGDGTGSCRSWADRTKRLFEKAMDDDLNISEALAHLFDFIRKVNGELDKGKVSREDGDYLLRFLLDLDRVLGLEPGKGAGEWHPLSEASEEVRALILERETLRSRKEFQQADQIRNRLRERGIILEDTASGPRWRATAA